MIKSLSSATLGSARRLRGPLLLLASALTLPAFAGSRVSANYDLVSDTSDAGGRRTASAAYTHDGSLGGLAGISAAAGPGAVAKSGYVGQLYEVVGTLVQAPSTTVGETGVLQLGAAQVLDDATTLALSAASVAWSVASGPITGISATGLASAGLVYQATPATVQGTYGGFVGSLNLTVLDTLPDNFGSYAGDGIDDAWQVQYFGFDNPLAAPGVDASGTGQNNLFKFVAGLDPLDPHARFRVVATPVVGQPTQQRLTFSPVVPGRTYRVRANADLGTANWSTLPGPVEINGTEGAYTDPTAAGARRFYEVQISKP
ncbi:MAG: hypothetical protein JSR82_08510 [Verrucomicrobia bacterium]|nr:hypothetical protein [Verrucomicrobiota bacterium]